MGFRLFHRLGVLAVLLLLPSGLPALAQAADQPLLITYGRPAPPREGDFNHRQVIYLSVPAGLRDRLYLRLFDPGIGSRFDEAGDDRSARTRFTIHGGAGAYVPQAARPRAVADTEMTAGTPIASKEFGYEPDAAGQWVTLAGFDPAQGDPVGDRRIFRLTVEGVEGRSGNTYDVFLSAREQRNLLPEGARMFSFVPTVRVPDKLSSTELRFHIPADAAALAVHNFDAAHAALSVETAFGS